MQLQKLVFITQGFSLAIFGALLHMHNTHTWQWEPVIPKLYKSLQKYGSDFVTASLETTAEIITGSGKINSGRIWLEHSYPELRRYLPPIYTYCVPANPRYIPSHGLG
ncbi:hypothetical protein SAMN05216339_1141 [Nitrosomonas eutropha]|uniref:Uncharacterized protein n=1 Tax=Nitrosomonas eutropha TaxID=916 RepID=A0A1I7J3N1_9PROT|nr:hypothetical protein [Nitrosomonas eutropha]SFU79760.1 hypothetical protein SAMN05216339_1141 [Nitrosomonas eutropha]